MKRLMWRGTLAAAVVTLGTGLVWAQTQAEPPGKQQQVKCPTGAEAKKRTSKLRQVSGTVLQVKTVDVKGTGTANLVALLKSTKNDRRVLVDLGPQSQLQSSVVPGERIAAEGVVVRLGGHQLLVANRMRDDGKVFSIKRIQQMKQRG